MRVSPLPSVAIAVLLLPLSGCCSLARFFCGPDRTPWVSVDYSTPEKAVKTLLEALRRADPDVLYLSLSEDYKAREGLTGLFVQVGWERFVEQNPGLHVAGYATVPEMTRLGPDRAAVTIDVEGTPVDVEVVRLHHWRVAYRRDGSRLEPGKPVAKAADVLKIEPAGKDKLDNERSALVVGPLVVTHGDLEALPPESIEFAGYETEWRVDAIRVREAQ